ncbi:SMP-30/gluconolactonase/LRE family protein [Rhodospirillaceae bacterium KN72]|uniref:SMP-30/gluconolactonase/LRE family protein n=1 Tax=Pacificispira spongiicola TaxID=2729598 RepID=A0A7Y0E1W0_9PROT|nr:hypothetical protein [Pacificispira spongiicola]NMM45717.1 SMP-30/gluconolactonase/LRE family protein [Pacificispira spongiicola]
MSGLITSLMRNLLGYSDTGISIPPMDNMFKPNNRLEAAKIVTRIDGLDDIAPTTDGFLCSARDALLRVSLGPDGARVEKLDRLDGAITFLAARADGELALATEKRGLRIGRPGAWRSVELPEDQARCLTAGCFLPDGSLTLCVGSVRNPASAWKRDLMQHGASGCVFSIAPDCGSVRMLADGLGFPYGIVSLEDGALAVSESWRHRVLRVETEAKSVRPAPMLSNLPAYPARIAPSAEGGYLLALFAPRRQLFEMILIEDEYRMEMMETIDPSEWVGPDLRQTDDPDQPLQQGSVRQMGILKPWAPSRSYGLVVRCDASMTPVESWHSRADGTRHGITATCERGGVVFAASKGAGELLHLSDEREGAQ